MPSPRNQTDGLQLAAAQVIAGDPELRNRVRRLVNGLLRDAEYTMLYGTPSERHALTRVFVPGMVRALQTAEQDSGSAAQREAHERMNAAARGLLLGGRVDGAGSGDGDVEGAA